MKKSALIAMAAIAAASAYHPEYTPPLTIANGIRSNNRGYRKFGKFGTEQRKSWLADKNLQRLDANLSKKMARSLK